jgi:hypothetical protein
MVRIYYRLCRIKTAYDLRRYHYGERKLPSHLPKRLNGLVGAIKEVAQFANNLKENVTDAGRAPCSAVIPSKRDRRKPPALLDLEALIRIARENVRLTEGRRAEPAPPIEDVFWQLMDAASRVDQWVSSRRGRAVPRYWGDPLSPEQWLLGEALPDL